MEGRFIAHAPDVRDREGLRVVLAQLREVRVHALEDDVQVRETEQVRRLANVQQLDNVGVLEFAQDAHFAENALCVFKDAEDVVDLGKRWGRGEGGGRGGVGQRRGVRASCAARRALSRKRRRPGRTFFMATRRPVKWSVASTTLP